MFCTIRVPVPRNPECAMAAASRPVFLASGGVSVVYGRNALSSALGFGDNSHNLSANGSVQPFLPGGPPPATGADRVCSPGGREPRHDPRARPSRHQPFGCSSSDFVGSRPWAWTGGRALRPRRAPRTAGGGPNQKMLELADLALGNGGALLQASHAMGEAGRRTSG